MPYQDRLCYSRWKELLLSLKSAKKIYHYCSDFQCDTYTRREGVTGDSSEGRTNFPIVINVLARRPLHLLAARTVSHLLPPSVVS